jgi:hypothetical protein
MKKILILLMSMAIFSLAFSKNIYLVIPKDATDVSYYAVDSNGDKLTVSETSEIKKYHGDDDINLVTLNIQSSDVIKFVAGYKMDGEYYFMVSSDADKDTIKNKIEIASTPFDIFDGVTTFGNYSSYPGVKVNDDVRLSIIAINKSDIENFEKIDPETLVDILGYSGVNPSNSDNNELKITYTDEDDEGKEKNIEFKSEGDILGVKTKPSSDDPLVYSVVTSLKFKVKNANKSTLTIDGSSVDNKVYDFSGGNMAIKLYNDSYNKKGKANGQWWIYIDGKAKSGEGDTIYLISDTGTVASSGIDVDSKVKAKSRKRDTRLETSIIDSENFVIENIKE